MKLLTSEWRKLWLSPSFLGLAAALLFLNAILLYTRGTDGGVSPEVWREVWQKLSSFPEEERAQRVQKQYEKMKASARPLSRFPGRRLRPFLWYKAK